MTFARPGERKESLWARLDAQTAQPASAAASVWHALDRGLDAAMRQPRRADGILEHRVECRREGTHYVLQNPQTDAYLKLSEKDYFIWQRLDGQHAVGEIAAEYLNAHNTLGLERIFTLLPQLADAGFLAERPWRVFDRLEATLRGRTGRERLERQKSALLRTEVPIPALGPALS
ncbi:MAG: PqqD family protein, partial [Planctomycetes bacterium]|nr:PqqD family protein [Planctomycetota bacterium]